MISCRSLPDSLPIPQISPSPPRFPLSSASQRVLQTMSEISPVPVIIDTDPGVDDVLALLLALSSPHLLVVGITLTHGNCTLASTEKNLEKMFYALKKHLEQTNEKERWRGVTDKEWRKKHGAEEKIKVWKGCEGPVEGQAVTAKYFHGQVRESHALSTVLLN